MKSIYRSIFIGFLAGLSIGWPRLALGAGCVIVWMATVRQIRRWDIGR